MKRKKIFRIISIMLIIIIFFPYTITFAASVGQVGSAIASFAKSYYDQAHAGKNPYLFHPGNIDYAGDFYGNRGINFETGKPKLNPYNPGFDHYGLDCVGFVSFCVFNATGIQYGPAESGYGGYVVPTKYGGISDEVHFEYVSGPAQAGDVLITNGHVWIYTDGEGVESSTTQYTGSDKGPFKTSAVSGDRIARVKSNTANQIDESTLVYDADLLPAGSLSSIFGEKNESEFYYNGIPNGQYSVTSGNVLDWIINTLKEIFSFIINIVTYIVRMVFVGWTFIVENMLTDLIQKVSGEENVIEMDATDYGKDGNKYTDDNVTLEKIIFDNVKIFNVDFFTLEEVEEGA